MKFRRILATAAAALLSTVAVVNPAAADDDDDRSSLRMTNSDEMAVTRGVDGWVNIGLSSRVELEDVRIVVEVDKRGVDIIYPGYGTSAGLSQGAILPAGGIDTARFMLSAGPESYDEFDLEVFAQWEENGRVRRAEIGEIEVELREHNGDDYDFLSDSATVSSTGDGSGNWVEMDFLGIAPMNTDFEIKIKKGLDEVYYPQEKYTSLHHDHQLDGQENDVARIWIDPATVEPGTYTIEIEVKYDNNEGKGKKNKHEMTITVE